MFQKKRYRGLWILFAILGLAAWIKASCVPSSTISWSSDKLILLNDKWEIHEIQGNMLEYRYLIPEDNFGALRLCMKTYMPEFQVFLEEEKIYSFSDQNGIQGKNLHLISLPEKALGKEVIVRVKKTRMYPGKFRDLGKGYLGEEDKVLIKMFRDHLYALIFSFFAFLFSFMSLFLACYLKNRLPENLYKAIIELGVFILLTGIWILTDSSLLLFWTDKTALIRFVAFTSFMSMPIFLLQFVYHMMGQWKLLKLLWRLFLIHVVIYVLNFLIEAVPGFFLLLLTHILCISAIIVILKYGYKTIKERKNENKMKAGMYRFGLLTVFVLGALISYYMNPVSSYPYLYCIGIFLFILCLVISAYGRLYEQLEENSNNLAYKMLAYTDSMTGMLNRTAFAEEQKKTDLSLGRTYLIFDINNLKRVNDQYGHQIGDYVIITAAKCMREVFEPKGKCYRIGGDEFVVILEKSTADETEEALMYFRKKIEQENEKRKIPIDIAAGYAVLSKEGETSEYLYRQADANMYMKKQKMKNAKMNETIER